MSRMYNQCFICREWSWSVSKSHGGVSLCLPCYVDVLEVRQARGLMGDPNTLPDSIRDGGKDRAETIPGQSPSPTPPDPRQRSLFEDESAVEATVRRRFGVEP